MTAYLPAEPKDIDKKGAGHGNNSPPALLSYNDLSSIYRITSGKVVSFVTF